jgi:hypothetical protein
MLTENLDLFVKGIFGETATIDGVEVWGVFDESYSPMFEGGVAEGRNITLLVKSNDVFFVSHGSSVNLKGRYFEVINYYPIDDGKLTNLILKEN